MKKKIIFLILLILIIAAGIYFFKSSHKPKPIASVTVSYGNITKTATAVGNIIPKHAVVVNSQVAGVVDKVYVQSGDRVKKGEKLILVKPNPSPTDLAAALSSVQIDEDNLKSDNQSLASYQKMLAQKVISSNYADYINTMRTHNLDKNTLLLDQQKLSLLQSGNAKIGGKLVQNTVTSPINGFVLQKLADAGDTVISTESYTNATPLFSLANMQDLQFQGSVDEVDADNVKSNTPATVTLAAFPDTPFKGKVLNIALQSNTENISPTGTSNLSTDTSSPFTNGFQIIIDHLKFPNKLTLRAGFSATASIVIKQLNHVLLIPERVLIFDDDSTYVNVLNNQNQLTKTKIKTGIADGVNIQILSGLAAGEKVSDDTSASAKIKIKTKRHGKFK